MHEKIKQLINRVFAYEAVTRPDGDEAYMDRWRLLSLWGGRKIYLHHFLKDDWTTDVHDHPSFFLSIGIHGSYWEAHPTDMKKWDGKSMMFKPYHAPWIRSFKATHRHYLFDPKGCWTIVYRGKTTREWGFWPDGKFVGWEEYMAGSVN